MILKRKIFLTIKIIITDLYEIRYMITYDIQFPKRKKQNYSVYYVALINQSDRKKKYVRSIKPTGNLIKLLMSYRHCFSS